MHRACKLRTILDQIVMLGAGAGDAGGVGFLKGVIADQVGRYLAGQADDGNRIHQRVGKAGNGIRCTRTTGYQNNADLSGRTCVTFGGMHGCLFMAY